jgi:hypothetical protein
LPILQKNCQNATGLARSPMSFSLTETRPYAEPCEVGAQQDDAAVVCGSDDRAFENARFLGESEIAILTAWAEKGALEATPRVSLRLWSSATDGQSASRTLW